MTDVSCATLDAAAGVADTVVVIDVLRAFTTAAFAFDAGARAITVVSDVEEAFALRDDNPDWLIMGEEHGLPVEGFDFDNSPASFVNQDLTGRYLIQRTSSGTQGVVRSRNARHLLAVSLCCARATAEYLRRLRSQKVTMVMTGSHRGGLGEDDLACGDYLEALIYGKIPDAERVVERVRESRAAQKFRDPERPQFLPIDLDYAVDIDRFSFAMVVEKQDGQHVMQPVWAEQVPGEVWHRSVP
ncbi:MAG: 2-phosphosulfolactate phosphatase [Chloroflexota bacterium]|nr:2-phosphosulfolactate phosphatase [Chloroflexota bacterium]